MTVKKIIRIMFYDKQLQQFVVDTMEIDEIQADQQDDEDTPPGK